MFEKLPCYANSLEKGSIALLVPIDELQIFMHLILFDFNYDTNTLVGARQCSLREIYMYQGFSEMV